MEVCRQEHLVRVRSPLHFMSTMTSVNCNTELARRSAGLSRAGRGGGLGWWALRNLVLVRAPRGSLVRANNLCRLDAGGGPSLHRVPLTKHLTGEVSRVVLRSEVLDGLSRGPPRSAHIAHLARTEHHVPRIFAKHGHGRVLCGRPMFAKHLNRKSPALGRALSCGKGGGAARQSLRSGDALISRQRASKVAIASSRDGTSPVSGGAQPAFRPSSGSVTLHIQGFGLAGSSDMSHP